MILNQFREAAVQEQPTLEDEECAAAHEALHVLDAASRATRKLVVVEVDRHVLGGALEEYKKVATALETGARIFPSIGWSDAIVEDDAGPYLW